MHPPVWDTLEKMANIKYEMRRCGQSSRCCSSSSPLSGVWRFAPVRLWCCPPPLTSFHLSRPCQVLLAFALRGQLHHMHCFVCSQPSFYFLLSYHLTCCSLFLILLVTSLHRLRVNFVYFFVRAFSLARVAACRSSQAKFRWTRYAARTAAVPEVSSFNFLGWGQHCCSVFSGPSRSRHRLANLRHFVDPSMYGESPICPGVRSFPCLHIGYWSLIQWILPGFRGG